MHSCDNASLSTLVTARFIRVPVTTDKQITTDECKNCWTECFVFGSRALIKGHVIDSQVEYLHRNPASRTKRRKGKSRILDRKMWSRVPRDSGPKMIALARTKSNYKRQTRPLVRDSAPYQQTRNCLDVTNSGRKPLMGALFQDRLAD
jgi:hypothetical protein